MDALFFCSLLTGHRALSDKSTLKFSESPKHVHHHAPSACAGVYRFGEALKRCPSSLYALENAQQVKQRAGEAVYFVDHHHITWTQTGHKFLKLGTCCNPAALLLIDGLNSSPF